MNINRAKLLQIYKDGKAYSYGGDQDWYSSNTHAMGGCGSVAGAEALRCLIMSNKSLSDTVKSSASIPYWFKGATCSVRPDKSDFEILMHAVYRKMHCFEMPIIRKKYDNSARGQGIYINI